MNIPLMSLPPHSSSSCWLRFHLLSFPCCPSHTGLLDSRPRCSLAQPLSQLIRQSVIAIRATCAKWPVIMQVY